MTTLTDLIARIDELMQPCRVCDLDERREELIVCMAQNWPVLRAACAVVEAARQSIGAVLLYPDDEYLVDDLRTALSALDAELGKVK